MKRNTRIASLSALAFAAALSLSASGCSGSGAPSRLHLRPSDGLLGDSALQRVVELQLARDRVGLVALLSDPRGDVRARAALALGSVQDPQAVPELIAALQDPEAAVRRDAAFALGQVGAPSGVAPLMGALAGEGDAGARRAIFLALSKLPTPAAAEALLAAEVGEGEEADRVMALARLAALRGVSTEEGVALLASRLDHPDAGVRRAAAYFFGRYGDPTAWLPHAPRVRDALGRFGKRDPAAMYLLQALGRVADPSDGVQLRAWAASAGEWRIRANAVAALGGAGSDAESREALLRALNDEAPQVAVAAAQALARADVPPSELPRIKAWIDAHPDFWQAHAPLLGMLARADEREYVLAWVDAVPPEAGFRWALGLQALAVIPGPEAVERLGRAVVSEDPRVQGAAVGVLVQRWSQDREFSGSAEAYFPVFAEALRGGRPQAAVAAARALADPQFAPLGAGAVLADAYRAMDPAAELEPILAVMESLVRGGFDEAGAVFTEAASSPDRTVRGAAAQGLAALGLPDPGVSAAEGGEQEGGAELRSPSVSRPGVEWAYLATLGPAPRLRLETDRGTVVLRLLPEEAPLTVQTVARLAAEGKYDQVPFHRVIPNFVVQGGDFATGDGFGGPGFVLRSEFTSLPFAEGVVGMASAGKDTEGSQFFITHSAQPHLDGGYTAFGWVVKGKDVVDRLLLGDRILKATVEPGR